MRPYWLLLGLSVAAMAGCGRPAAPGWQGYLEGDFVYIASPLGGKLESLGVHKGDRLAAGAPLFFIEHASEVAGQNQAAAKLGEAEARLADLQKGSRPSEIEALEARLGQARAAEALSGIDLGREEKLFRSQSIPESDYDHARLIHQENQKAVEEINAQIETAKLEARADAIAAARAEVQSAQADLKRATWNVEQKSQNAPKAGLVYDTLYREGEYVAAGSPVVALLPPENLKVRFFVAEKDYAALKMGQSVRVAVTEGAPPLSARISYLSPQAEYTPPVLYNRDNRAKLVYMVEAEFAGSAGIELHPGQPVDVMP